MIAFVTSNKFVQRTNSFRWCFPQIRAGRKVLQREGLKLEGRDPGQDRGGRIREGTVPPNGPDGGQPVQSAQFEPSRSVRQQVPGKDGRAVK